MTRAINATTAQGVATALMREENSNLGGFSLTPPSFGLNPIIVQMPRERIPVTTNPGRKPAMKSFPMS
jgi:hypothetical protein